MLRNYSFLFVLFLVRLVSAAQIIPATRTVNWSLAGLSNPIPEPSTSIDIASFGGSGDSITNNDLPLQNALASVAGNPTIIYFPAGNYQFTSSFNIPSGTILRGDSTAKTNFLFNLSGAAYDLFGITGSPSGNEFLLNDSASRGNSFLLTSDTTGFLPGDYIKIFQDDSSLVNDSWAYNSIGQILKIVRVAIDSLFFESPLRRSYLLTDSARIRKINPISNVGFECFYIERLDVTTSQTSNFNFDHAVNCRITGVESNKTNFAHVSISSSSNILIRGNYFHHAFAYSGGGKGYGVMLQFATGEVLVENNIFKTLRHAMILQAGANGNVFGYNYSLDPYWNEGSLPANSAGDMVLHGNYPYTNLFEGNICQNMVVDNSHYINGPYNTFFRNRAAGYGLIMNNSPASNDQNFSGNEITNTATFMGQYYLSGTGHFEYGNNVRGTITPAGTSGTMPDSYYLSSAPAFFGGTTWPTIGGPHPYNTGTIPAQTNFNVGGETSCYGNFTGTNEIQHDENSILIYPNPCNGAFKVFTKGSDRFNLKVINSSGTLVYQAANLLAGNLIQLKLTPGMYLIRIEFKGKMHTQKLIIE
ncbi:MAG: T9SS type A sorting domain-containing protein [Bacteroidota bacterium]|nr:T9SS type A sorting domain-containing protein [Bacteroidota bacterium]